MVGWTQQRETPLTAVASAALHPLKNLLVVLLLVVLARVDVALVKTKRHVVLGVEPFRSNIVQHIVFRTLPPKLALGLVHIDVETLLVWAKGKAGLGTCSNGNNFNGLTHSLASSIAELLISNIAACATIENLPSSSLLLTHDRTEQAGDILTGTGSGNPRTARSKNQSKSPRLLVYGP